MTNKKAQMGTTNQTTTTHEQHENTRKIRKHTCTKHMNKTCETQMENRRKHMKNARKHRTHRWKNTHARNTHMKNTRTTSESTHGNNT